MHLQEVVAHSGSTVGFSCGEYSPSHDCEILLFLIGGQLSELSTYKRWLHIVVQLYGFHVGSHLIMYAQDL